MWRSGELSLAYLTVDGASPVEHIEAAAAADYAAAGVRILPPVHLSATGSVVGNPDLTRRVSDTCSRFDVQLLDAEVASLSRESDADDTDVIPAERAAESALLQPHPFEGDDRDVGAAAVLNLICQSMTCPLKLL